MLIFVGLLAILVVLIYTYFTWNNDYFIKMGVPSEKPVFFFGNLKDTFNMTRHYGVIYKELYEKFHYSPVFGVFRSRVPILIVRDLEVLKNVLIKDFNHFASTDFVVDPEVDPIFSANPFVNSGERWKLLRTQWSLAITSSKIRAMHDNMLVKTKIMIEYLKKSTKEKKENPTDAKQVAVKFLTDSVVSSVLGLENNSFENPNNVYRNIVVSVFESTFWEAISNLLFFTAPFIMSLFKAKFVKEQSEKDLRELTKVILKRQKEGLLKNGIFDIMIKENATEDEIAGRMFGFLSEGIETSSGLVAFTLYELGMNPEIQKKLRDELNEAAATNKGVVSYEHIQSLPYFIKVISEVGRLYPGALTLQRICTSTYKMDMPNGQTITIPEGMPVSVPVYAIQTDEKYYPNPFKFDPERFTEEAIEARPKMAYMPFGEGPRICLGTRLAMTQSKTCIAAIVRNFNIKVNNKTKPKPLQPDAKCMVYRPVGGLWLDLEYIGN